MSAGFSQPYQPSWGVFPIPSRSASWTGLQPVSEMPAWPQLPVRNWLESMYVQYSERLPGAVVDRGGANHLLP